MGLFKVTDPSEARGNSITARELLDKGAQRIESDLSDQPEIQASLMSTMGNAYKSLGLYSDARSLLDGSLQRRRKLHQNPSTAVTDNQTDLAGVLTLQADYVTAREMYLDVLNNGDFPNGDNSVRRARAQLGLAELYSIEGAYEDAEPLLREGLAVLTKVQGEQNLETLKAMEDLGLNLFDQGQMAEAEQLLRHAVKLEQQEVGEPPHPQFANLLNNLAYLLHARGENEEAGLLFQRSLEMNKKLLGDSHPTIAIGLNNLAFLQQDRGNYAEAERLYREAIAMNRELLGDKHPEIADGMMNLAFVLHDKGDRDGAFRAARDSLSIYRQLFAGDHPDIARVLTNLGGWLMDEEDYSEARPLLEEGYDMQKRLLGADHPDIAFSAAPLAQVYLATGQFAVAERLAHEARLLFAEKLPQDHWRIAWAMSIEGAAKLGSGDVAGAEKLLVSGDERLQDSLDARPGAVVMARKNLMELYAELGDNAKIAELGEQPGEQINDKTGH